MLSGDVNDLNLQPRRPSDEGGKAKCSSWSLRVPMQMRCLCSGRCPGGEGGPAEKGGDIFSKIGGKQL